MKKIIFLLFLLLNLQNLNASQTIVDDLNFKIKTNYNYPTLVSLYNEYHFDNVKDIIIFFNQNKAYKQFDEIFNSLSNENKLIIIGLLIDNSEKFKDLIYNIDIYTKLFTYTNNVNDQEFQFESYKLLLENKNGYHNFLQYSKVENQYLTIFNPYNLINLDKRYLYFATKMLNDDYYISYANCIQYLSLSNEFLNKIKYLNLTKGFDFSINKYSTIEKNVLAPISLNSIFYDRSNDKKAIHVNYSFYINGKLKDIIINLKQQNNANIVSHELLKTYLKDGIITNNDLLNYLEKLNFKTNTIKITPKVLLEIETLENGNKSKYFDLNRFIITNSTMFLY